MDEGFFITLEGGDGSGKSTLMTQLARSLTDQGYQVTVTREPGGVEIAERIRDILLDPANTEMDARTEALLYAAARRQHLVEIVLPALNRGEIVLCDRFIDSSLAYQGNARGLGMDEILTINLFAVEQLMPDITLFLDLEPETGLARIHHGEDREINRLDLEQLDFHRKVREGYQQLVKRFPERMKVINAEQAEHQVLTEAVSAIAAALENR